MPRQTITILASALFVLLASPQLWADTTSLRLSSCLEQARTRILPDRWVKVTTTAKAVAVGRLVSIQSELASLTMTSALTPGSPSQTFSAVDIAQIQYRKSGKIRPDYMLLGAIAGGLIGGAIGKSSESGCRRECYYSDLAIYFGAAIGAGAGLVIGTVVPAVMPSTRTIRCP